MSPRTKCGANGIAHHKALAAASRVRTRVEIGYHEGERRESIPADQKLGNAPAAAWITRTTNTQSRHCRAAATAAAADQMPTARAFLSAEKAFGRDQGRAAHDLNPQVRSSDSRR